jgi:hypothetical protein
MILINSLTTSPSTTKEEDADDNQGNKAIDNHGQKSDPTIDENATHPRIAVGENYEPKGNTVKEMVEECCLVLPMVQLKPEPTVVT